MFEENIIDISRNVLLKWLFNVLSIVYQTQKWHCFFLCEIFVKKKGCVVCIITLPFGCAIAVIIIIICFIPRALAWIKCFKTFAYNSYCHLPITVHSVNPFSNYKSYTSYIWFLLLNRFWFILKALGFQSYIQEVKSVLAECKTQAAVSQSF